MDSELLKPELWIGIDQSYSGFGLVALTKDGIYDKQLWNFTKNKKGDFERLKIISDMLVWHFYRYQEQFNCNVAMEGYAHGAKFNREKLGELGGIVKVAVYDVFKKDALIVAPTVLKKFVTGKGTASKDDMVASVNSKWRAGIMDHNVADAFGLAQYLKENSGIS